MHFLWTTCGIWVYSEHIDTAMSFHLGVDAGAYDDKLVCKERYSMP